jgi:hypothetical protein
MKKRLRRNKKGCCSEKEEYRIPQQSVFGAHTDIMHKTKWKICLTDSGIEEMRLRIAERHEQLPDN